MEKETAKINDEQTMPTENGESNQSQELQQAINHIRRMRVVADPTRRKCVDGGYRENEAPGATAIAGADFGVCLALLKLGFNPRKSFELVYSFVRKNNQPFSWHSDTHAEHGAGVIGCGHCNQALERPDLYDVKQDKARELIDIVGKAQKGKSDMELVVLDREHAEQGILLVTSPDFSVKPWDEERDIQYFVWDQTRQQNFLREFAQYANQRGEEVRYDALTSALNSQLDATLKLLPSSRGKPIFQVDVSASEPKVKFLKNAPRN